jgi:hypothetical protein
MSTISQRDRLRAGSESAEAVGADAAEALNADKALVERIECLTNPRIAGHLFQDATGLLVPGFTALPAVSVLAAAPPRNLKSPEHLAPGQLYSFEPETDSGESRKRELTFFTPVEDMSIRPVSFSNSPQEPGGVQDVLVESESGWNNIDLYFVWLPWDHAAAAGLKGIDSLISLVASDFGPAGRLQVSLVSPDGEIPLFPKWGLRSWIADARVESLIFPLNYARHLLGPFFFRVGIASSYTMPDGRLFRLQSDTITLRFRFPQADLRSLYSMAGLSGTRQPGFSVIGNAVPIANIDLKAWEPGVTYSEFVRTSSMKPLGFACVARFKLDGEEDIGTAGSGDPTRFEMPISARLSLELDKTGEILPRYSIPGSGDADGDTQILFWMTHGSKINGRRFRYADTDRIQPMHATSLSLKQAGMAMPCFGGCDYRDSHRRDLYKSLMLGYGPTHQMLWHKDSLRFTVEHLLAVLGYGDHEVGGPSIELRVCDGVRRRVAVVYVSDNAINPIVRHNLDSIQDYLDQCAPVGSKVLIEVR